MARATPRPTRAPVPRRKTNRKPTPKVQPKSKTKPKSRVKTTTKPKPKAKPKLDAKPRIKAKPTSKARATKSGRRHDDAIPTPIAYTGSGRVLEIIDDAQPIAALRRFLEVIDSPPSAPQSQVVLGSAQLMLLPIAREHRGGSEVKELLDLVLSHWTMFPEPAGFHAQEFLRHAFAAVGDDRVRLTRLMAVVPANASAELRFNIACAHALVRDKVAMMHALRQALAAGISAAEVRRDNDFAPYAHDPEVQALLDGTPAPQIPVDIAPHLSSVRGALDSLVATLKEFGETIKLNPPAALDTVLAVERGRKIQLPNDYRALLTLTDGMTMWDHDFFGTLDYRSDTKLARRAREYVEGSARHGASAIDECVPLASWGGPDHWLLYDPRGSVRDGRPGYVVMSSPEPMPVSSLVEALERIEAVVRDVLGTN